MKILLDVTLLQDLFATPPYLPGVKQKNRGVSTPRDKMLVLFAPRYITTTNIRCSIQLITLLINFRHNKHIHILYILLCMMRTTCLHMQQFFEQKEVSGWVGWYVEAGQRSFIIPCRFGAQVAHTMSAWVSAQENKVRCAYSSWRGAHPASLTVRRRHLRDSALFVCNHREHCSPTACSCIRAQRLQNWLQRDGVNSRSEWHTNR